MTGPGAPRRAPACVQARRRILVGATCSLGLGLPIRAARAQERVIDLAADSLARDRRAAVQGGPEQLPADQALAPPQGLVPQDGAGAAPALHSLYGPDAGGGRYGTDFWRVPRSVWLYNVNTREQIRTTYWARGQLIQPAYDRLCWFLRDHRMQQRIDQLFQSGQAVPRGWYSTIGMSPAVLDILYALGAWLEWFGMPRPVLITSAHRHDVTSTQIEGAVKGSKHRTGSAADVVIEGVSSSQVGRFGSWLRSGGVGFYPDRHFTHLDDGPVRHWTHYRSKS